MAGSFIKDLMLRGDLQRCLSKETRETDASDLTRHFFDLLFSSHILRVPR